MALKFGKRDLAKVVEVLDAEHETAEDAALAVMDLVHDLLLAKAKFTVVGQVSRNEGGKVLSTDPAADKIALGWYATEKQALGDAIRLAYSTQTHEEHKTWVLPVFIGTPNAYYIDRKVTKKLAAIADGPYREREIQRRVTWFETHHGEPAPPEWGAILSNRQVKQCPECTGTGMVKKTEEDAA